MSLTPAGLEIQRAEKRFVRSTITIMTAGAAVVDAVRAAGLAVSASDPVSTAVARLCSVADDNAKALHIPSYGSAEHCGLLELAGLMHSVGLTLSPETLELEDREPVAGPSPEDFAAELSELLARMKAAPKPA